MATTCNDLSSVARRKALRRCPDMSRKRDGIAVTALSFLLSPLDGEIIGMYSCVSLDREDRLLRCARRASDMSGAQRKAYRTSGTHKVVTSRRAKGAVKMIRSRLWCVPRMARCRTAKCLFFMGERELLGNGREKAVSFFVRDGGEMGENGVRCGLQWMVEC